MPELRCRECNVFLGKMIKGSIHKRSCLLCENCIKRFETYKSLADQKYSEDKSAPDMPDFMKDVLGDFGGKK